MTNITLYHNPRCSKSRLAVQWLEERDIDFKIVEYLKTPLKVSELQILLQKLNYTARDLTRKQDPLYKEMNLGSVLDESTLIKAMVTAPKLIERPILVVGDRAVLGRPVEKFETIL